MFATATYFGFYPMGAHIELQGIKIMQTTWTEYNSPTIVIGKKNVVNPLFGQIYYVMNADQIVFFMAIEYGLGHYHIFTISDRAQQRLSKRIKKKL